MATIIRNGQEIKLTNEEIRSIIQEEHRNDVRFEYEQAVQVAEEDDMISFAGYADCEFSDYSSEADAREDFIDKLTDDFLEEEEMYERDPHSFRSHDYEEDVLDLANDLGYMKGV